MSILTQFQKYVRRTGLGILSIPEMFVNYFPLLNCFLIASPIAKVVIQDQSNQQEWERRESN